MTYIPFFGNPTLISFVNNDIPHKYSQEMCLYDRPKYALHTCEEYCKITLVKSNINESIYEATCHKRIFFIDHK